MVIPTSADWRDLFCGRESESATLRDAYDAVADGDGPRAVVILGDRGMGKTRLVREFYSFLSRERDPEHYWPDGALFQGRNVLVGPDVERDPAVREHFARFALASRHMPFLWWGLRLSDPDERNASVTDLATHRRFLDVHLEPLRQARRLAANRSAVTELGRDVARSGMMKAVEAIPFLGQWAGLAIEAALFSRKRDALQEQRRRLLGEHQHEEVARLARLRADDVLGSTLADLEAILSGHDVAARESDPGAPLLNRVPLVLFIDDAQFARRGGDEGVLELVVELWRRAVAGHWPLLLVAAHWEREWWEAEPGDEAFAGRLRPLLEALDGWRPIALRRESQLDALVRAGLPGVPPDDVALVLDQADGNPQLLLEIVERIGRSPVWREPHGGLSLEGRRQLATARFDLHRLIRDRMESDATPDEVRRAVAVCSVQGMEFSCTLSEAVAEMLHAGPVRNGLTEAEERHRYVLGVDRGVAAFVQRAYRQAAVELVGGQLGSTERVDAALASAADSLLEDASRWATLNEPERDTVLSLCATLGEHATDAAVRRRASDAMLRLVRRALEIDPQTPDVPRAARWGRRIATGLMEGRFAATDLEHDGLALAAEAVRVWDGAGAALPLLEALVQDARSSTATERISPQLALADGLRTAGRFEQADVVAREALASARELVHQDSRREHRHLLYAALSAEVRRLGDADEAEAALQIRVEQYELARSLVADAPDDEEMAREWTRCAILFASALNAQQRGGLDLPLELLLPARAELAQLLERHALIADVALLGHLDLEIARTLLRRREPADADRFFRKSVELFGTAYAADPRYAHRRGLLEALSTGAEAAWTGGERERALALLHEARAAMERVSPPPDLTYGVLQMTLYLRLVTWTIRSCDGAPARLRQIDEELGAIMTAARALLPQAPIAAGTYGEMMGRLSGALRATAAISGADGDTLRTRVGTMRGETLALFDALDRDWAGADWFDHGLREIDEQLRGAVSAGDRTGAVAVADAMLWWALDYQATVADDAALGSLLHGILVAGHAVLECGARLDPELVRACAQAAVLPWQDDPIDDLNPWMRAPALSVLATLGADLSDAERHTLVAAAIAAFDDAPSWMGRVAGYEMEVELELVEDDRALRCHRLETFASAMQTALGADTSPERLEWRWLERLRQQWACDAPNATAGR